MILYVHERGDMTPDTLKSLGFLKKSLKMNAKAIAKNEVPNPALPRPKDIADFLAYSIAMLNQIDIWEKAAAAAVPVVAPAPAGVVQPAPAASTVSVVPLLPDTDDDLLTVP